MVRFNDKASITTISGNDILPMTPLSDTSDDRKVTVTQLSQYTVDNISTLSSGKSLTDNNLTNTLKTEYDNAVDGGAYKRTQDNLLEYPDLIKYENGTNQFSIKSGSILTKPDGTTLTLTSDLTYSTQLSSEKIIFSDGIQLYTIENSHCFAGTTEPTTYTEMLWYDSTNNIIKYSSNTGVTWSGDYYLPLGFANGYAITTCFTNTTGYMGPMIWVLQNTAVNIPNGKNSNGSFNNTKYKTTSNVFKIFTASESSEVALGSTEISTSGTYTVGEDNYVYDEDEVIVSVCPIGEITVDNNILVKKFEVRNILQLATKADLSNKINLDYSNATVQPVTHQQITNCILEDPQNINLTLSNGTLTLKAGSIVCVPNGFEADGTTLKFDEVTISSDLTLSNVGVGSFTLMYGLSSGTPILWYRLNTEMYSGVTAPTTTQYMAWYDTTNNLIKNTEDTGSTWSSNSSSFPIAQFSVASGTTISSIDQTFQSIGYIGSTVFVRKGLKVLIPNGRNDDDSLKNIEYTTTQVKTNTLTYGNQDYYLSVTSVGDIIFNGKTVTYYNESLNYVVDTYPDPDVPYNWAFVGQVKGDSSNRLSNFKPYTATNILKYSDSPQISGWSMPSSRYTDLTLGASGSTYTAPANGWFKVSMVSSATSQYLYIGSTDYKRIGFQQHSAVSGEYTLFTLPVKIGETIIINYNMGGDKNLYFTYAEGEQS